MLTKFVDCLLYNHVKTGILHESTYSSNPMCWPSSRCTQKWIQVRQSHCMSRPDMRLRGAFARLCLWPAAFLHIPVLLGDSTAGPPLLPSRLSGRRDWGIENFISPTLLRNMRGKDIKKAISYHMKRNQVLLDPRQKVVCVPWVQGAPQDGGSVPHGQRCNVFPPWVFSLRDHLGLFFCLFLL